MSALSVTSSPYPVCHCTLSVTVSVRGCAMMSSAAGAAAGAGTTGDEKSVRRFSAADLAGIRAIASEQSPFELLVYSLCPGIFGHEIVKAGLTLALFGGSPREGTDIPLRYIDYTTLFWASCYICFTGPHVCDMKRGKCV